MKKHPKKPWPTKEAMIQVYENNLWGGDKTEFYSGLGSHDREVVTKYINVVSAFLKELKTPPVVCDLGCGDFNVGKELVPFTKHYHAIDIVPDLIAHHKRTFTADNLSFYTLDIAKDELPTGDCAIVRQVLQHLSNVEIKAIVEKLYSFTYVILTEHLPEGSFIPNVDILSGQGTRLKKNSGVDLLAAPFHFKVTAANEALSIPSPHYKGRLVTTVYTL